MSANFENKKVVVSEIENLAKTNPEKIIKYYPQPLIEFLPYEAREIARKMDVPSELISQMGDVIWKLYNIFDKYDCEIAEINPLVLTPDGLIAADAKLEVENDALYRHQDLVNLLHYKKKAVDFVKLDGDIAVIGNGAGLTLTAMDMIKLNGGEPATFLDIGGGASEQIINQALNIVLNYDPVKVVFLNVLGGITKADDVARGVIKALEQAERDVPIVIRLTGTNEKEGQRLLEEAGIPASYAPKVIIADAEEMDFELRKDLATALYTTFNCSLETTLGLIGVDLEDEKRRRISENEEGLTEIFAPYKSLYTNGDGGDEGGRPESNENEEKQQYDKEKNQEK